MKFNIDCTPGPVYGESVFTNQRARAVLDSKYPATQDYVVIGIVHQTGDGADGVYRLRRYYALNLTQAVARAAELAIRLPAHDTTWTLLDIRPATTEETNLFFRLMDHIELRNNRAYTAKEADQVVHIEERLATMVADQQANADDPGDGDWHESEAPRA